VSDIGRLQATLRDFAAERDWEKFHTPKNLAMALAGEVGELLAEFQWLTPDQAAAAMGDAAKADAIRGELADVMIYLVRLADVLEVDLVGAAYAKIDRNQERFPISGTTIPHEIVVRGSPIAGEDPREKQWRRAVAEAAAGQPQGRGLGIVISLEPGRRVDIDNLARVVLAGLRDAGVCSWGFRGLDELFVTKRVGEAGATIALDPEVPVPPSTSDLAVTADALPGTALPMQAWQDLVAAGTSRQVAGPAWVDIAVRTERSLEGLMKRVIDGLSPLLGRDPKAHLPFTPNDHLVERLIVRRVADGPVLVVRAGPLV